IGMGQKHKLKAPNLIGLINEVTNKRDIEIGKIEILRNFSFFEADSEFEKVILDSFANEEVEVQVSNPETKEGRGEERSERRSNEHEKRKGSKSFGGKRGGFENKRSGGNSKSGRKSDFGGGKKQRGGRRR